MPHFPDQFWAPERMFFNDSYTLCTCPLCPAGFQKGDVWTCHPGAHFLAPADDLSIEGSLPGLRLDLKFRLQFGVFFGWLHEHPFRRVGSGAQKKTPQKWTF